MVVNVRDVVTGQMFPVSIKANNDSTYIGAPELLLLLNSQQGGNNK